MATGGAMSDEEKPVDVSPDKRLLLDGTVHQSTQQTAQVRGDTTDLTITMTTERSLTDLAQDGGWGWFVVAGAALSQALMGGVERANGIIYLQLQDRYHGSATSTAQIFSIFTAFRLLLGPLASAMVNRFSCRTTVMVGGILAGTSFIVSGFVPDLTSLCFSYGVLGGFGRCMATMPALIIVGYYFNKRRGLAVGLTTAGVGVGTVLIPPLVETLFKTYDYAGAMIIMGAVSFNFLLSAALFRPLKKYSRDKQDSYPIKRQTEQTDGRQLCEEQDRSDAPLMLDPKVPDSTTDNLYDKVPDETELKQHSSQPGQRFSKAKTCTSPLLQYFNPSLLRNGVFLSFCMATMLFTTAFHSSFVFLPALMKDRGLSELQAAYILSISGGLDASSRLILSTLLDLKRVKPFRIYIYNSLMFFMAGVTTLIPFMQTFTQFTAAAGLYGFLCGGYISQRSVIPVDILGIENLSNALGLLGMLQGVGSLLGPTVGGILKDNLGHYSASFYGGAALTLVGALILMAANIFCRKKHRKT